MTKSAEWHGVGVQTAAQLARKHRRLGRRVAKVTHVVNQMQRGASLLLQHTRRGRVWRLSTGAEVPDETAREVIARAGVVGVSNALFQGMPFTDLSVERGG
jgi:hypothetical protein